MTDKDLQDIFSFAQRNGLMRVPFINVCYAYKSLQNRQENGTTARKDHSSESVA